jgi:hypothetical protein
LLKLNSKQPYTFRVLNILEINSNTSDLLFWVFKKWVILTDAPYRKRMANLGLKKFTENVQML